MRNQWLSLLLRRCHSASQPYVSQVRSLSCSRLHPRALHAPPNPFSLRRLEASREPGVEFPRKRSFSFMSYCAAEVYASTSNSNKKRHLCIMISDLECFKYPDAAKKCFECVLENERINLSPQSYNSLLYNLGHHLLVKETCGLIEIMKKKCYEMSKHEFVSISKIFQENGFDDAVEKLKEFYTSGERDGKRVSDIIKREVWGDDVKKWLLELDVELSSGVVVKGALENLREDPEKALCFFRWVQESGVFEHCSQLYGVVARLLVKADWFEEFWRVIDEMRSKGHEMLREYYPEIVEQLVNKNAVKDAVELFEFAANGLDEKDCSFLLKTIVEGEELDMNLFSKVLRAFNDDRMTLEYSTSIYFDIIDSLIRVGRRNEFNRLSVALKEAGYETSSAYVDDPLKKLMGAGETALAVEFVETMMPKDPFALKALFVGFKWESEKLNILRKIDHKATATRCLSSLVSGYISRSGFTDTIYDYSRGSEKVILDAYKLVSEMNRDFQMELDKSERIPLIKALLDLNHFDKALDLVRMQTIPEHGMHVPLYLQTTYDFFWYYFAKTGNVEEAFRYIQVWISKGVVSEVYLYELLLKRYVCHTKIPEALDLISEFPEHIRNNEEIAERLRFIVTGKPTYYFL